LAPAARALGVNATTVGRRLTALEQRLGARLFDRTPEGLVPTEAAAALLPHAEAAEAAILAFERQRTGVDARLAGEVRLATSEIFGPLFLLPRLEAFRRQYPEVQISLQVGVRTLDLSRREADIAIRLARPSEEALIARKLGGQSLGLYGSKDYLAKHGTPSRMEDLRGHQLLGYTEATSGIAEARWLRAAAPEARYALQSDSPRALLDACVAGQGLAVLPRFLEATYPSLRYLPLPEAPPSREVWAVVHRDLHRVPRIQAVVSFLVELFNRESRLLLEGVGKAS
jgi:DNA-binding transcriptional LysR family regulator